MVIGDIPFRCGAVANKMRRGLINGALNRDVKHPIPDSTEQRRKNTNSAVHGLEKQSRFFFKSGKLKLCARASTLGKVPFFGSFFGSIWRLDRQAKNEQTNLSS